MKPYTAEASSWQKYLGNPVLVGRGLTYWEGNSASNGQILKVDNQYKAWFFSNNGLGPRIGYANSTTGTGSWDISQTEVLSVGTPDGWEKATENPSVLYDSTANQYKMWYTSINTDHWPIGLDRFRIRYATSQDGKNWNTNPGWVLYGSTGKWDEGGIDRGLSVLKVNGTYQMWYTATNSNDLGSNPYWRIGYATSPDGINWTKQNNGNPVIEPTESWEGVNINAPTVLYENGTYKMWYTASLVADIPYQIVYATSTDGIHWTKPANMNPAITPSAGFDSNWAGYPSVLNDNGTYKMWYTGNNGQINSIGLATMPATAPISLQVPLVMQTSSPWNTITYDSADIWAPTGSSPTINDWGCALTSAVMILQYNGITTMPHDPNNTPLDPGSLNNWLKSQPDGYIGDGLVNWLAIPRLTRLASLNHDSNPKFLFHALMYQPVKTSDTTILTNDLSEGIPDIVTEPGHFVVATGTQGSTFTINDPYYNRVTLDDSHYQNTFSSIGRYFPSFTDLSYILVTAPPNVSVTVKDDQNNSIGRSFVEQIGNATTLQSGNAIQTVYAASPSAGMYHIDTSSSSPTPYDIHVYLYDIDGNVKVTDFTGNTSTSDIVVNFNKQQVTSSTAKLTSFATTIQDIQNYQNNNQLPFGIGQASIAMLQSAQKDVLKNNILVVNIKLDGVVHLLSLFKDRKESDAAYQTILDDLNSLKFYLSTL